MVIAQTPNPPLIVALAGALTSHITSGRVKDFASAVFYTALTIWAYEEAVNGVNWFRRVLGIAVGVFILVKLSAELS